MIHLGAWVRLVSQSRVHVRAMDGCVTTRRPAGSHAEKGGVIGIADINVAAGDRQALHLGVAAQAKIGIAFDEHLLVDGAVRTVADDTAFAQRVVLKNKGPCLIPMALGATLVLPRHGQPAGRFHDVHAVRVVALDAVHASFQNRMVLGKMELSLDVQVALKTSRRILAWIDNEAFAAAQASRGDMFAAGTVAGFAPALAGHRPILSMNPRVRTGRKPSHNVAMTIRAGLVADEMRAGDFQRRDNFGRSRRARNDQQCGQGRNPEGHRDRQFSVHLHKL
jgi:hypothetical protein